jgi:uncharacterized protein (TIGR02147 family)
VSAHLFEFTDYRQYLELALSERGKKKELSEFIPCQTTFLSNVMSGSANLSLEHAMRTAEFLHLSEKESHYFMLIVQLGKAGSKSLENYYLKQIHEIQKEQNKISSKIASHEVIALHDQVTFYNSWIYAAIHILCAVEEFQSRKAIRDYFHLPSKEIDPVIDFMIQNGVIKEINGQLKQGSTRVHLPKGSPFLIKHHSNWRMKAIQSLDYEREQDLHYTMVMSLSKKDVERMKQIIFEAITRTDQLLKETGDETVYSFCMDWFKV